VTSGTTASLSNLNSPTADFSFAGFKLTDLGTPTAATDAATKAYVDSIMVSSGGGVFEMSSRFFNIPGTYNIQVPYNFNACEVIVIGGGGGGGPVSNNFNVKGIAGGGYAGAFCWAYISGFPLGTNIQVVIGSGGSGFYTNYDASAQPGGFSRFGNYVYCEGGAGGRSLDQERNNIQPYLSAASFVVSGVKYFHGMEGEEGSFSLCSSSPANIFLYNNSQIAFFSKSGGNVPGFGIGGKTQPITANNQGKNARGYGAGGGGAIRLNSANRSGGNGAPGLVLVKWYRK
jgi:hypothetical protein